MESNGTAQAAALGALATPLVALDATTLAEAKSQAPREVVGVRYDEGRRTVTFVSFEELRMEDRIVPYEDFIAGEMPLSWRKLTMRVSKRELRRREVVAGLLLSLGSVGLLGLTILALFSPSYGFGELLPLFLVGGGVAFWGAALVPGELPPPRDLKGLLRVPKLAAQGITERVLSHEEVTRMAELSRTRALIRQKVRLARAEQRLLPQSAEHSSRRRFIDKELAAQEKNIRSLNRQIAEILREARRRSRSDF